MMASHFKSAKGLLDIIRNDSFIVCKDLFHTEMLLFHPNLVRFFQFNISLCSSKEVFMKLKGRYTREQRIIMNV